MTCKICMVNKIQLVLLPCAHLCACRNCAAGIRTPDCPVCKTSVSAYVPVYYT